RARGEFNLPLAQNDARTAVGVRGAAAFARVAAFDELGHWVPDLGPGLDACLGVGGDSFAELLAPLLHRSAEFLHPRFELGIAGVAMREGVEPGRLWRLWRLRRLGRLGRLGRLR